MARKYQRPVKRYPKPRGYILPKPGDVKPGTIKDRRQLDLFEAAKRLAGDYVATPLPPHLALQLLEQRGDRFSPAECGVLRRIGHRLTPGPDDRAILNGIFARLGAPSP